MIRSRAREGLEAMVDGPVSPADADMRIGTGDMFGVCPEMRVVWNAIEDATSCESTVLVLGETGTGKDLFARTLHARSRRREAAFVTLNCCSVAATLFESELFGHVPGAFTGAVAARPGILEEARGGTLFLDEIGELPPELQAKLLRARSSLAPTS